MDDQYSTYEAKARFSEVLRMVREGKTIVVTYHGQPVAEIRPYEREAGDVAHRLDRLEKRGVLARTASTGKPRVALEPVTRRPGALARFLAERDG